MKIREEIHQPKIVGVPIMTQTSSDTLYKQQVKNRLVQASQQMNYTDYKTIGLDPKTREVWTDAKARDTGTHPMVGEIGTDPKMQDVSLDAWKRDGAIQTS